MTQKQPKIPVHVHTAFIAGEGPRPAAYAFSLDGEQFIEVNQMPTAEDIERLEQIWLDHTVGTTNAEGERVHYIVPCRRWWAQHGAEFQSWDAYLP
jgi:hypothetical protein